MSLTNAGARLSGRLQPAINQITDAVEGLNTERGRPYGMLRLHVHGMAATAVSAHLWERVLSTYLEAQVDRAAQDIVALGFSPRARRRGQTCSRCGRSPRPAAAIPNAGAKTASGMTAYDFGAAMAQSRHGFPSNPGSLKPRSLWTSR